MKYLTFRAFYRSDGRRGCLIKYMRFRPGEIDSKNIKKIVILLIAITKFTSKHATVNQNTVSLTETVACTSKVYNTMYIQYFTVFSHRGIQRPQFSVIT